MKKSLIWCLLGSVLLTSVVWSQADKGAATQHAVAALEKTWLESQRTNNTELVAPLLTDNFMETSGEGKLTTTKAEALADAKKVKWSSVDYVDLKITVFGNTAVATGGFKAKGTDTSGKAIDENSRFTDTWVKMPSGKWQCVASQDTPVT
jgi:ketosteroid isomerase-like protein